MFGRHGDVVIDLGGCGNQQAIFAIAGNHDLAVLATFERGFETVQAQIAFWPLFSMTAQARCREKRAYVFGESNAWFAGGGRKFSEVDLVNVPLVASLNRRSCNGQNKENRRERFGKNRCAAFSFHSCSYTPSAV